MNSNLRKFLILFFLLKQSYAYAKTTTLELPNPTSKSSILFGHNLTPTTNTLKKANFTVGNYLLGLGLTDNFTIVTSPWMYISYNTYTAGARYKYRLNETNELGVQFGYFKSFDSPPPYYRMEITNTSLGWSKKFSPHYTLTTSLNHMYFLDETWPYSLRREPHNDQPYQFSLTTLHQATFVSGFGGMLEAGCLGLNYTYPQIYLGMSLHYLFDNFLIQLGVSANATPAGFDRLYTRNQGTSGGGIPKHFDFSPHPEAQLQAFF